MRINVLVACRMEMSMLGSPSPTIKTERATGISAMLPKLIRPNNLFYIRTESKFQLLQMIGKVNVKFSYSCRHFLFPTNKVLSIINKISSEYSIPG